MQGTIRSYSSVTRSGSVLLDDGTPLDFDHSAFDRSGLRLLRFGQRVRLQLEQTPDGPRIVALSLATLPLD